MFPPPTILNVKNPFDREKLGIALQDDSDDNDNNSNYDDDTAVFFDGNVLNISLPVQEGEIAPYDGDLDGLRDEVGEAVRGALGEAFKDEGQGQDQGQVPYPPVVRVEVSGSRRDEQQRILINARSDDIGESSTTDGIAGLFPGFPRRGSQDGIVRQTTARPETVKFELEDAVVSTPSDIGEYEYPNNIDQSEFDPAEYEYGEEDDSSSAIPADTDDEGAPFDNRILGGRSSANIVQATVVEDLVRTGSKLLHDMTQNIFFLFEEYSVVATSLQVKHPSQWIKSRVSMCLETT